MIIHSPKRSSLYFKELLLLRPLSFCAQSEEEKGSVSISFNASKVQTTLTDRFLLLHRTSRTIVRLPHLECVSLLTSTHLNCLDQNDPTPNVANIKKREHIRICLELLFSLSSRESMTTNYDARYIEDCTLVKNSGSGSSKQQFKGGSSQ